jgi:serine/threonine protein kinase
MIAQGMEYDGKASDIWSCGVILYALLMNRLPFDDEDMGMLLYKVRMGKYELPEDTPVDARDLIGRMLCVDPNKRITVSTYACPGA